MAITLFNKKCHKIIHKTKKFREKKGESLMSFSLIIIIASVAILLFAFFFVLVVELLFFLC
jgi:hypothetical protein